MCVLASGEQNKFAESSAEPSRISEYALTRQSSLIQLKKNKNMKMFTAPGGCFNVRNMKIIAAF